MREVLATIPRNDVTRIEVSIEGGTVDLAQYELQRSGEWERYWEANALTAAELPVIARALVVAYRRLAPERFRYEVHTFNAAGEPTWSTARDTKEEAEKIGVSLTRLSGHFKIAEHAIVEFDCECELGRP